MKYTYLITLTVLYIIIQISLIEHKYVLAAVNVILMVNSLIIIWKYYEKTR